jgi:hypothetical protein
VFVLISAAVFQNDGYCGDLKAPGLPCWADAFHHKTGQINTNDGGRGLYWDDPNGHATPWRSSPTQTGAGP